MSQFIISPTASQDLEEIVDYLSDQSLDVGEQFLVELTKNVAICRVFQAWVVAMQTLFHTCEGF